MFGLSEKDKKRDELSIRYYGHKYIELCSHEKRAINSLIEEGEDAKDN